MSLLAAGIKKGRRTAVLGIPSDAGAPVSSGCFFLFSGWSPFGGISRVAGSWNVMGAQGWAWIERTLPPARPDVGGIFSA